jgi:hypothetical protein
MLTRVNEGVSAILGVTFKDHDGQLQPPLTIRYRVDCVDNKQELRDWTVVVSPASEIEIELTPSDNAIVFVSRGVERHVVTVEATYSGDGQIAEEYEYEVKNLRFLNS